MGETLVGEIIGILVSGVSELGQGIASGISDTVKALFVDTTTASAPKLSTVGAIIATFAAIGLAVGLTRLCVKFVMSLGGSNRF